MTTSDEEFEPSLSEKQRRNKELQLLVESSDDEEEDISESDLAYLRKGERRGYLSRQSNKDKHTDLWHKRYCVLTDKLWVLNITSDPDSKPRGFFISLSEHTSITAGQYNQIIIDTGLCYY